MADCVLSELKKGQTETRHYIFKGEKVQRSYYFGHDLWSFKSEDVYHVDGLFERVTVLEVDSNVVYEAGVDVIINGRETRITKVAQDVETGDYIVFTDYVTEVVDDEASRQAAEAKKEEFITKMSKSAVAEIKREERRKKFLGLF